jgi:hypothetical protein
MPPQFITTILWVLVGIFGGPIVSDSISPLVKKYKSIASTLLLMLIVTGTIFEFNYYKDQKIIERNTTKSFGYLEPLSEVNKSNEFNVFLGDTATKIEGVRSNSTTTIKVLSLNNGESYLNATIYPEGKVLFEGNLIFNQEGSCYVTFLDGEYKNSGDCIFSAKQPNKSTLIIKNRKNEEVFLIEYININTIKLKGKFYLSNSINPLIINSDKIITPSESVFMGGTLKFKESGAAFEFN